MCPSSTSNSDPHADEGLIFDPPSSEPTRGRQYLAFFVSALFLVALIGTLVVDTIAPLEARKLIGQEFVEHKKLTENGRIGDGSSARLVELYLQRTSIVRKAATESYSYWLYRYLGLVRPVVVLGDEGWLYHKQRALALESPPDAPLVVACSLAAMERTFAAAGIKVVSVCIPRKVVTHPENLPRGIRVRPELDRDLSLELGAHGVVGPDLLRVFRNNVRGLAKVELNQKALYGVTDSHWTPRAEMLAARATTRDAGLRVAKSRRIGLLRTDPNGPSGRDMVEFAGLSFTDAMNEYLLERRAEAWLHWGENGKQYMAPANNRDARIVLCGTSFSARRKYPNFLAHFAGETVQNLARLGGDPTLQLRQLLDRGRRPEVVIMEYPNHTLFRPLVLRQLGASYVQLEFGELPVLVPNEKNPLYAAFAKQPIESRGFVIPLRAPIQHVVHSGDGVLAWRLRGEAFGAGVTVRGGQAPAYIDLAWSRGVSELLVPVVTAGTSATVPPFLVRSLKGAAGLGKLRLDSVELVLLASEEGALGCELRGGSSRSEDWSQEFSVPGSKTIPNHAVLTFRLDTKGTGARDLGIEVWGDDEFAAPVRFDVRSVANGSRVFCNLNAFAGRRISAIVMRGREGTAPMEVIGVRILRSGFD